MLCGSGPEHDVCRRFHAGRFKLELDRVLDPIFDEEERRVKRWKKQLLAILQGIDPKEKEEARELMSLILKQEAAGKPRTPVPEGPCQALCIDVIDLGEKPTPWGPKEQVKFVFETKHLDPAFDNAPMLLFTFAYTKSLNEKSNLRKMLEAWRGKRFSGEDLKRFDLNGLCGKTATVIVVHKEDAEAGIVYSNISGIFKDTSNVGFIKASDYVRIKDREENGGGAKAEEDEEDLPF